MAELDDPFSIGQLVGMMVIITYIENNGGTIPKGFLDQLARSCAEKTGEYMGKPTEDVYLMVENLVKDIEKV